MNPPTKKTKQVPAEVQTHNGVEQPVVNHEVSEQKDTVSAPQNASVEHYGRSENLQYTGMPTLPSHLRGHKLTRCTAQMLRLLADYTGKPEEVILPERAQSKSPLQKQNSIAARSDFSDESQNSDLPRFVKSLEDRIATDDLEYLRAKGALTLPAVEFRDALIWSFFEHVHPLMPVLDLDQFLQPILDGDDESGQVSLLLYQAVLFAGTAHVKMEFLKEAGFKTRRHARKVLFQRVRVSVKCGPSTLTSLTTLASLRLQCRIRPCRTRPSSPPHDSLVRNSRRAQKHLALDRRCHFPGLCSWSPSRSLTEQYLNVAEDAKTSSTSMVGMLHA